MKFSGAWVPEEWSSEGHLKAAAHGPDGWCSPVDSLKPGSSSVVEGPDP